jgi:hypothetical protein
MDVDSFSPGQDALSKSPAATHGLVGRSPASAEEGGLLFGDFLLAIQEKVTRAPKAHESSWFNENAACGIGSPARGTTTKQGADPFFPRKRAPVTRHPLWSLDEKHVLVRL